MKSINATTFTAASAIRVDLLIGEIDIAIPEDGFIVADRMIVGLFE